MFLQHPGKKPGGVFHSRLGSRPSHISKLSSGLGLGMRKKKLDHSNGGHTQLMARASLAPIEQQQQSHELAQMNALKITQEELQRDLETLGLQQQESQRLLDNAKNFKERRVHQHAELESKLEHIKYKVGQERAELQRRHHLLSSGQRALSLARLSGDRTGDDLRALDRKLKQVLETKRTLFFYQRKQDRLLHDLRADLSSLAHEKTEATAQVHAADQNLKKLKLTEHSLRQRIQSESKKLAAFSQQTTLLRAETMSMEHMIDEVTDALELSEAAHAKCAAETVSEEDRHNKAVIALEAKIEGKYSVHRKLSQEMQVLRQTALDHQSDLHLAWERTIYAQIANGMTPSKSQNESNIPPVLEFGCVEVKVETETKACEEEAQIIEDLKATLSSFKDQLDEMEERANTSSEKVELEQGAINNARKTEESRRDEASKFLIDIVTLRRENEHVRASFDTLRSLRDDQNAGIKRSIDTVRQENGQAEHNRSLAQHRLSKVATEVRSTSASALREKEAIALKLAEFESEISTVHQCNLSAKEELNRLSSIIESQDKLSRNSLGLSQSAAKKNIAEILNEYPDLESVRFGYDPKKTLDEQADESLKLIVAHCKHRLNSAKKMQAGLREAAKLEDLELREMQKAAAIESKRKFKIREYRKHRLLSGTSGNAIKQSNLKDEKKHKSRRSLQSMRVKASAWIGDEKTEKTRRDKKKMRREELQHQTEIALENSELNSVAKPRDLLEVFSRVGDDGGKSTYDLEACAVLTQTTAGSEKKVTWEEDNGKEKRTSKISKKDCTRGRKTKECLSKDSTEKPHIPKLAPSSLSATMLDAGFQEVSALLVEKEASSHRISSSKPVVQKSYTLPSVDRISREPRSQDLKKLLSCKSIGHTGEKTRSNSSRFGNPKKRDIDVTTNPRREMPHSFGSTKPISKTRGENAQSLKEWSGSSTSHRAFEDKTNSSKTKDQERRTTSHQREKGKRSHRSSADVRTASTDHKKMNYHLSLSHNSNPSLKRNSCQTSGLSSKERPAKSRRRLKSRSSDVLKNQIQTFGDERYSFGFATS